MAWVHLSSVYGWDFNGKPYALLGQLYYDNVQDIAGNRTLMKIEAYKYAGGGLIDFDVRPWAVNVAAVAAATGGGGVSGDAAPRFDGMSAGDTAHLGTAGGFYVNHAPDGTAQVLAAAVWNATSSGSHFDSGFYGEAGPLALPSIPRGPKVKTATGFKSAVWKVLTATGWKSLRWRVLTATGWKDVI